MRAGLARVLGVGALALWAAAGAAAQQSSARPARRPVELRTLKDIFLAMEVCWRASLPARVVPGMTVKVLVSFKRNGEMFGEPKFTYVTPRAPTETVAVYERAAAAAIARCNPLPFSDSLGNAVAGRPCIFQFIDRRNEKGT